MSVALGGTGSAVDGTGETAPVLEARGITMRFGGTVALNDVSLEVPAGEIVGLIGPNGAGKTTLFHILSGLLRPTRGAVLLKQQNVSTASPQRRSLGGLARTFQHPELFSALTVREHLVIAYRAHRDRRRIWTDLWGGPSRWRPNVDEDQRVDRLLDMLGIAEVAHRRVVSLPLGTARRVEVGRALAAEPDVVLLDEPSSGLDVRESEQLRETLVRARDEQGVAMLLVEHDLPFVLGVSDYVYVLNFGILLAQGSPDAVRSDPAVQAAYIGGTR